MELWGVVLSSGVAVAVVTTIKELLLWKLNKNEKIHETRIVNVEENVTEMQVKIDSLMVGTREVLRDRIEHLISSYIKRGYITLMELEGVEKLHSAYHELGGNGFLNELMERAEALPIKHKGEDET